jgi:hypothetical protein
MRGDFQSESAVANEMMRMGLCPLSGDLFGLDTRDARRPADQPIDRTDAGPDQVDDTDRC